jgi:hypothetical protein
MTHYLHRHCYGAYGARLFRRGHTPWNLLMAMDGTP